jgi:hypothetical protein
VDTLAAVEAFLDRTRGYEAAPPPQPVATLVVSPPAVRPGGGSAERSPLFADRIASPAGPGATANVYAALASDSAVPRLALPVVKAVRVNAAPVPMKIADEQQTIRTTNAPLDVSAVAAAPSMESMETFLNELEHRAVERPDLQSEWSLRLAQLALFRDTEALAVSPQLAEPGRSLLSTLLAAAVAIRRGVQDPALDGAEALRRVDALRAALADRADPVVSHVVLCRRVVTFGVYEKIGATGIVAGRTAQAIVYSEVRNLRSEPTKDGGFRSLLATHLEVLTSDGASVWRHEEPEIVDQCRTRRTDFFIAQRMTLPPTLPAGDYVLKVLVEDRLSGRAHEAVTPLVIHSELSAATTP